MMERLWSQLCRDDAGVVLSAELVIIVTVVVLGLVVGLAHVQTAVVTELQDTGAAIASLNQSYGVTGFRGCRKAWGFTSWTAGSAFTDVFDTCLGGVGTCEIVGGATYVESRTPVTVAPTPTCTTCVPEPAPHVEQCLTCPPSGTSLAPVPQREIPQGPAPQNLPQQ
jgi:hypothetical protein